MSVGAGGGAQRAWNSDDGMVPTETTTNEAAVGAKNLQAVYSQYADVMYTNAANLQHTIALQQNLFQQQLAERQRHVVASTGCGGGGTATQLQQPQVGPSCSDQTAAPGSPLRGATGRPSASPRRPDVHCQTATEPTVDGVNGIVASTAVPPPMEWVVKRRSDGTRYITRRPRIPASTNGHNEAASTAAHASTPSGGGVAKQAAAAVQQQQKQHHQQRRRRLAMLMLREERARQVCRAQ